MSSKLPTIAIVGVTGAVGREMLTVLEQQGFEHGEIRMLASARSAGQPIPYRGRTHGVSELTHQSLRGVDVALFSAGSGISKEFAPPAAQAGTLVVDNSSAFRMDAHVPLVVPEINPQALPARGHGAIVANPNCSTIIMLMALTPLQRLFGVQRVIVSTYQAASGAGAQAMKELIDQTHAVLHGQPAEPKIFHEPYAFNLFSHNAGIEAATGLNGEESKMIAETKKIWGDDRVQVSPTCVRVPVLRAHSQSINVTLRADATLAQVRAAYAGFPGVRVVDDRAKNLFPTPMKASGGDDVLVGRLRADQSVLPAGAGPEGPTRTFEMFIAGDQLRKGAALNAVQIAQRVLAQSERP